MYAIKNEEQDQNFVKRSKLIRNGQTPVQCMEYLDINKKFFLIEGVSRKQKTQEMLGTVETGASFEQDTVNTARTLQSEN